MKISLGSLLLLAGGKEAPVFSKAKGII